jgi:ankyrin repeat protein
VAKQRHDITRPDSVALAVMSSLLEAAKLGNAAAVVELIAKGADIEQADKVRARFPGEPQHALALLSLAVSALPSTTFLMCSFQAGYDKRPLHWAAQEGHLAVVKALVHARAEIDAQNRFGRTPLYEAAWHGHFEITYWLWRQGASKYTLDKWGEQAAFVSGRGECC